MNNTSRVAFLDPQKDRDLPAHKREEFLLSAELSLIPYAENHTLLHSRVCRRAPWNEV